MHTATQQLREMLADTGEEFPDLVLIRHGSRSVYRSDSAGVVLRVHDFPADVESVADRNQAVMSLAECGAPVLPPREVQPIRLPDGRCVTVWAAGESDGISVTDLGAVLRDLHEVGVRAGVGLPVWDPFPKVQRRIHAAAGNKISAGVLALFEEEASRLVATRPDFSPSIVAHGDAHLGNMVRVDGRLLLIDLDEVCLGMPEVDVTPTLLRQRRFGMPARQVDGFLAALDPQQPLDDAVVEWMCEVRELTMITWLAALPERTNAVEGELHNRLSTWNTGGRWHLV